MILRRVIEHFRKQEWTAIFLDFVIVVLGVFVGIQVSNWNAARADRAEERQLLTRLRDEVGGLLEIQKAEYAAQLPRVEAMARIHSMLFDPAPGRLMTEADCRLIAISHWLPAPTDELPVMEESIATGRFDLISSEGVKASLRAFMLGRDRSRRQYGEATNELFRLASRRTNAVWYVRKPIGDGDPVLPPLDVARQARRAGDGFRWSNECDLEEMRRDRSFLGEYVDNVSRLNSYVERYEDLIAVLDDLGRALDVELGVEDALEKSNE